MAQDGDDNNYVIFLTPLAVRILKLAYPYPLAGL